MPCSTSENDRDLMDPCGSGLGCTEHTGADVSKEAVCRGGRKELPSQRLSTAVTSVFLFLQSTELEQNSEGRVLVMGNTDKMHM